MIKLLHALIWVFFVFMIGYVVYAGLFDEVGVFVWVAIGLVILEGVILLMNEGKCLLTPIAARYTVHRSDNFDIFLLNWLARHNKVIFTIVFSLGVVIVICRLLA